jgi:hypothetical protein
MRIAKMPAAAAAICLVGLAAPVAASADTTPVTSPLLTFVPPKVGQISVSIGPTIIGGKVISPGVNVRTTPVSLPTLSWRPPVSWILPH